MEPLFIIYFILPENVNSQLQFPNLERLKNC